MRPRTVRDDAYLRRSARHVTARTAPASARPHRVLSMAAASRLTCRAPRADGSEIAIAEPARARRPGEIVHVPAAPSTLVR